MNFYGETAASEVYQGYSIHRKIPRPHEYGTVLMASAEEMKKQLGPTLCLAKWQQVSLHLTTGMNNLCYHPPLHEMDASIVEIKLMFLGDVELEE